MLNRALYKRLKEVFGKVRRLKKGVQARISVGKKVGNNLWRGKIQTDGENYAVNCPYCGDTRSRLCFSYLYCATVKLEDGRTVSFPPAVWCFNETHCTQKKAYRKELRRVVDSGDFPILFRSRTSDLNLKEEGTVTYPKVTVPINELSPQHPAYRYMEGRGFDLDWLATRGVQFCTKDEHPFVEGRVFLPLFNASGEMVGGQCRMIRDLEKKFPPKYFTLENTPVSRVLYGIDQKQGLAVVTEGPLDALTLGPYGKATLGSSLSIDQQKSLLLSYNCILFAYDSDLGDKDPSAYERYRTSVQETREAAQKHDNVKLVDEIVLPPGQDPNSLGSDKMWSLIFKKLEEHR